MNTRTLVVATALLSVSASAYAAARIDPQVQNIVNQVSADRIAGIQQKLETFQTRNIFSSTTDPVHGIGAAREWIAAQFRSYSPRLQVTFDKHRIAKQNARMAGNVEIWNVVAVLPGTSEPEREVLITGHYDTINLTRKGGGRESDPDAIVRAIAPGVTDDGSGTAAVMELARVMSQYQFRKTLVFIAFAAEEYGLFGSGAYAEAAAEKHEQIEGVFNNDIIGSDVSGNGKNTNLRVNVYSEDPGDSSSRQLARYFKTVAERYQPGFSVNLVFRHDRFGRGGDHSPFNAVGYPAVRVTTASENFSHQHTETDTFANTAPDYTAKVARANASAAASLALAPKRPELAAPSAAPGRAYVSPLGRGKMPDGFDGYHAVLRWKKNDAEPDLAGYVVVMRQTTAPEWEREIFVGNVDEYVLPDVNIDEVSLGVKAVDKAGHESTVTAFVTPPYKKPKIVTY